MNKKTLLSLFLLIVILSAVGAFLFLSNNQNSGITHKMILGENGYEPQDITIKKGDTIEFSTSKDAPFWPASNIHPTHGIYPEFDPLEPVPPNKTWSFKFNKTGSWNYHDHLYPYYTGLITVE